MEGGREFQVRINAWGIERRMVFFDRGGRVRLNWRLCPLDACACCRVRGWCVWCPCRGSSGSRHGERGPHSSLYSRQRPLMVRLSSRLSTMTPGPRKESARRWIRSSRRYTAAVEESVLKVEWRESLLQREHPKPVTGKALWHWLKPRSFSELSSSPESEQSKDMVYISLLIITLQWWYGWVDEILNRRVIRWKECSNIRKPRFHRERTRWRRNVSTTRMDTRSPAGYSPLKRSVCKTDEAYVNVEGRSS